MKNLLTVTILALVFTMAHAIAQVQHSHRSEVPVQYSAPADGHYVHGEYCMDSRAF